VGRKGGVMGLVLSVFQKYDLGNGDI